MPVDRRASQHQEHLPSMEETAASMRQERGKQGFQVTDSVSGIEAGPVGVKEQEAVRVERPQAHGLTNRLLCTFKSFMWKACLEDRWTRIRPFPKKFF